jgi:hypothetical protein
MNNAEIDVKPDMHSDSPTAVDVRDVQEVLDDTVKRVRNTSDR